MQKQEAQNIIESTFNASFSEEKFTLFIKNLLNDIDTTKYNEYHGQYIKDAFKDHIKQYKRIGKYTDPNGDALDVLIVEVKDQTKLDKTRTSLRNFVISHLDSFEKDYALVAFYSNSDHGADWRFSFVKLEYKTEVKEGKLKQSKELTPAKRYSFLVGVHEKAHTAKKQLLPLLENVYNNPTLEELEEAFSIEKVTDEFFEQYKSLFLVLTEQFDKDRNGLKEQLVAAGIDIPRFTKKLLGQIVFLYFLQKKGWLGVPKTEKWGKGEKKYLQKLYNDAEETGKNFFGDYLQHLFYEALAHKHSDEGIKGYYKKLGCKVPFLNGGLFEADYDWENSHITIPNDLFRNEEKINKTGDVGTGVLDVFDRYNFTIKEDEPLEKEVAVDPEMLGKVFENMLEVIERKSKGAFYTPREIVHYMCQESLIHYLDNAVNSYTKSYQELGDNQTNLFGNAGKKGQQSLMQEQDQIIVPKDDIEVFIRKGFFALENDQRVLREGKETPTYKFKLPDSIRNNANLLDQKLADIKVCDPAIGSGAFPVGMLHEIVNARLVLRQYLKIKKNNQGNQTNPTNHGSDNYAYHLKRHTIQESIYGVDIDASAIDIARLRLWLSLVVDEEDLDNIEALPNLDYKIVCGNSLIGLPENAMRNLEVEKELETLKEEFFTETDETHKKELRTKINTKIRQLLDTAEEFAGYKIDFDFKLFFSEVWHYKGGFDVVIGNPPYLNLTKNNFNNEHLKIFNDNFTVLQKAQSKNLYSLFIELGHKLLNKLSTISMIVPESLAQTRSYKDVRSLFKINKIDKLLTFKNFVFSHAVIGNVVFFTNPFSDEVKVLNFIGDGITSIRNSFKQKDIFESKELVWQINPSNPILDKIEKDSILLDNMDCNFSKGMVVKDRTDVLKEKPTKEDLPFILGKNLSRYNVTYSSYANYNDLTIVGGTKKLEKHLITPRILIRRTGAEICAAYSNNSELIESTVYIMTGSNLLFLLGLLNSKVLTYYLKSKFITNQQGYPQVLLNDLILIPVKLKPKQEPISTISQYLCFLNQNRLEKIIISYFNDISNACVFELYFPTEIKSAGKEILKYLGNIKPISDSMSEEEKLAIIQSEFERLYDPNHPVRNNVETLDSVEEVRIIREALK